MCNFFGSLNRFQAPEPPDRVGALGNEENDGRSGAASSAKRLAGPHEQSCPPASDSRERPAPLSPTPWRVERSHLPGMAREARVVDADGDPVTDYIALMDAETIADAVNARAALCRTPPAALDVVTQNPPLPAPEATTTA